jgi:hypothetical protein
MDSSSAGSLSIRDGRDRWLLRGAGEAEAGACSEGNDRTAGAVTTSPQQAVVLALAIAYPVGTTAVSSTVGE